MPETPFQPQLDFSPHNNQSLFSDHYLQEILRRTAVWRDMQGPAGNFLAWLQDLYARERHQLANYNESQLEDNWIKPILDRLGHVWEGQASIPGLTRNIKKPDFAFFPDEAARQTAVPHQNTPQYTNDVLALLEAKKWTVNLSKKSGPLPRFDDQNPMYQIDTYLSLSGVTWGVVSNGRFWRLVHKNSSRTLETYFEIDLLAALEAPNDRSALAVATFFWAFFNQTAFRPDAHGTIFLDEALSQSKAYAIALEADLRDNAYRSLEQLIIGFFAGDARLDAQNADHRAQVYQNSLYLLYRLLFLFYGEARALLPMGNPTYKDAYSLQTLANDFHRQRDRLDSHPTTGRRHWDRLQELFRLISGRDAQFNAELGVPRYNGGLFDPDQHPFLECHFVGDRGLAKAIDYLAYRRVREDGRFQGYQSVDYRTLDVRQLGSIYEGLLEYKVAVATEEMVTVRQKGVETWLPARQSKAAPLDRRQPGELYLTNDKGERKATGSYYTPDYIVEYIVENTLGPLVAQARERVKAQVRQTGSLNEAERQRQSAKLFVQEILALNVLDPAMGSGHFLVEATNFLARALATDEYAAAQIGPFSENGPISETSDETDLLYWKRRVVEACIYGVDKNPMAVELAKLSLWLKTAAADKPLSFLDHHLQHGDSLIGAWLDDLNKPPRSSKTSEVSSEQAPLFDDSAFTRDINRAVADIMTIERLPTLDIDDVHAKETTWKQIRDTHVARWRRLADLWVSAYFGNGMTPEEYRALAAYLQPPGGSKPPGGFEPSQPPGGFEPDSLSEDTAQPPGGSSLLNHFLQHPAVTDNDYFHWELAFPEVFFDEYGRSRHEAAGFDAVIGNPPYVRQEQLTPLKPYFEEQFDSYSGTADLYLYFYEQGIKLLQNEAFISYISSGTFAKTNSAKPFRKWLPKNANMVKLIDFGENQPFEGAEMVRPSIVIMTKGKQSGSFRSMFMDGTTIWLPLEKAMEDFGFDCDQNTLKLPEWTFQSIEVQKLAKKLFAQSIALEEFVSGKIFYGIKTGLNDAFYIDSKIRNKLISLHPSSESIIKPMFRGGDLRPWYQVNEDRWLIFSRQGINIDDYPAIKEYLEQFRSALEPKPDNWQAGGKSWPGRKGGAYKWYELQDTVAYYTEFEKSKILWADISKLPRFSLDHDGNYVNDKGFIIAYNDYALLGLLQSRVTWFSISQLCVPLRLRAGLWQYQLKSQFISRLPIPDMSEAVRENLGAIAMEITELARLRYQLHEQIRHRILTDLGTHQPPGGSKPPGGSPTSALNNALTAWWDLDFPTFRAQIKKLFKRDIPLKERHEWELFLADARQQHQQLTHQIITLETELNQHVYTLFHLTPEEIQIIETSTKYPYGEV